MGALSFPLSFSVNRKLPRGIRFINRNDEVSGGGRLGEKGRQAKLRGERICYRELERKGTEDPH